MVIELMAYIISYIQIFLAWHEHHDTFVTGVMGTSLGHTPSVLLYLLVLMLQSGVLAAECRMVEKLNAIEIQDGVIIRRIRTITLIACVLAAVIAFIMPMAAIVVVIAVSVISVIMVIRYDISIGNKGESL